MKKRKQGVSMDDRSPFVRDERRVHSNVCHTGAEANRFLENLAAFQVEGFVPHVALPQQHVARTRRGPPEPAADDRRGERRKSMRRQDLQRPAGGADRAAPVLARPLQPRWLIVTNHASVR